MSLKPTISAVLSQLVSGQFAALPIDAIEALLGSLGNKPEAMVTARCGLRCNMGQRCTVNGNLK